MFGNLNNSFKTLIASSLILSASFFVQNSSALAGGFKATCKNIGLINGVVLRANCRTANNNYVFSALNLPSYIGNIDGDFAWRRDGNYIASCRNASLAEGGTRPGTFYLAAICRYPDGKEEGAIINLNEKISNQNGVMAVDGF